MDKILITRAKKCLGCAAGFALIALTVDKLCLKSAENGKTALWPGVLSLDKTFNTGAAFSLFRGGGAYLTALTGLLLAALCAYMLRARLGRGERAALCAVLAGGLINWLSRMLHGGVTDYFRLEFMRFPVFNAADALITVGAAVFCVLYLFTKEKDGK